MTAYEKAALVAMVVSAACLFYVGARKIKRSRENYINRYRRSAGSDGP